MAGVREAQEGGMTARDVATYVSVFQPGVLSGTSAEYTIPPDINAR
jgi:hypothetical protein